MNNEIDSLLPINVLKEYEIIPDELVLIQGGTIKTVWQLSAGGKRFCLKRLKQTYDKALFSVNAQIYIKAMGGKVPDIVLSKAMEPIVSYNGELFVLYEWIDGDDLNFNSPHDLRSAVQGLAAFHVASKGYVPPENARVSTKLRKWPSHYKSMQKKFILWSEMAGKLPEKPQYREYLKHCDSMVSLAEQAIDKLHKSCYEAYTSDSCSSIVLCHQDYGRGNVLSAPDGIFILDLDGVTFDLPARDLRKIIGKNAEKKGQWQPEAVKEIIDWYNEVNPLNDEEINILYVDLLFPHWFFGLVKNQFQKGKILKPSKIEKIARLEEAKLLLLNTIDKGS